jgi:alpha-1,2-mannosyltransferase
MTVALRIAFYSLFVALGVYAVLALGAGYAASDFRIYTAATEAALRGESAYLPYDIGASFVYHPVVLSALALLHPLGDGLAFVIWTGLSLAGYALLLHCIQQRRGGRSLWLLALFAPFLETLLIGQINIFVTLAMVGTWLLAEQRRDTMAGAALALAIALKLSPALLLVYFIVTGRWRVVAATIITLGILTLIPLLQFGITPLVEFASVTVQTSIGTVVSPFNLSVLTVMTALGIPAASLMHKLLLVALVLLAARLVRCGARMEAFALLWITLLVLSPLVWLHHFVFVVGLLVVTPPRRSAQLPLIVALFLIQAERVNVILPGILTTLAAVILAYSYLRELAS